ncbi:hypothetical protein [Rhodoplanes sp. Z2-YC6860]|uniref:hypothetical protein n=1 Tax=Rhodoplanes sp. Z2-YC6860 TaxID=674703 RepID=UPI0008317126|nr:hypothetical protein [Rhodoplanes sp. Z2-YC6860]
MVSLTPSENINAGKPWSEVELKDIREFAPLMTSQELADYLGRSEEEVIAKVDEMGLEFGV